MCGICGIVSSETLSETHLAQVTQMSASLVHRGPDGSGEFHNSHIALGMRRLSIIDLQHGWQPLYNEDNSIILIANGEIYDFIERREQLRSRGHRFRTGSDCEIIVHLYEEYEEDCVNHLRGMFAFALWDKKRQRLMLARDRMGEKPLYLFEGRGYLMFASEMKALLASKIIPFELDPHAVNLYFHYQYVPEPSTIIRGVRKLSAAHSLIVNVAPWDIKETRYWSMEDAPPLEGEPAQFIRSRLEEVSELIIRSDVPVGVALSSGLDSSAITTLAVKTYPDKMHAFCVGYPGRPRNDERDGAKALADYLEMPFHDIELTTQDMVSLFPNLVYWRDDPVADISGYSYYAVMKLAQEYGVKVMLQGQGGDELFWGYPWVVTALHETRKKASLPSHDLRALLGYIKFDLPEVRTLSSLRRWVESFAGLRKGLQGFMRYWSRPRDELVFYNIAPDFAMAEQCMQRFYTSDLVEALHDSDPSSVFTFPLPWTAVDLLLTRLICQTYLQGNGIAQGDRLSMASSVELRLPLVDYKFVETVIGLRKAQSDDFLQPKAWLKSALQGILPDWVMNRPKKGFAPPVRIWHDALFAAYGSLLYEGILVQKHIIRPEIAIHLTRGPFPNKAIAPISFKALTLEMWCRIFSDMCE